MSITNAMNLAISGLRATQRDLSVVSGNVANSETPGYTRKTLDRSELATADRVIGVQADNVRRVLDEETQSQLRRAGADFAGDTITAQYLNRIDIAFGTPGSASALDSGFNQALTSLEAAATSPDNFSILTQASSDLQVFTQQLNSISNTFQSIRREADQAIADTVLTANNALEQIEDLNKQIITQSGSGSDPAYLQDQRDRYIDELAQIVDIEVTHGSNNAVQIRTGAGHTLFDGEAFRFDFQPSGTISPQTQWDPDRSVSDLDSVRIVSGDDYVIDLFSSDALRGGVLKAYQDLRDDTLVQAQAQLDEYSSHLALAVSRTDISGSPIANGQSIDLSSVQAGDEVAFQYTDTTGARHDVTIVAVFDAANLPITRDDAANPKGTVVGIDFSNGFADVATDISNAISALGPGLNVVSNATGLEFTTPTGATLNSLSASSTQNSLTGASAFPLFVDTATGAPYSNAPGTLPGKVGLAGRIGINSDVIADPFLLANFNAGTQDAGDATRVRELIDVLNSDIRTFNPDTGIGSEGRTFSGTLSTYLQTVISQNGAASINSERSLAASETSFNALQEQIQAESGVNIDQEMARLVELQQAYSANARVVSVAQEMIDTLLRI